MKKVVVPTTAVNQIEVSSLNNMEGANSVTCVSNSYKCGPISVTDCLTTRCSMDKQQNGRLAHASFLCVYGITCEAEFIPERQRFINAVLPDTTGCISIIALGLGMACLDQTLCDEYTQTFTGDQCSQLRRLHWSPEIICGEGGSPAEHDSTALNLESCKDVCSSSDILCLTVQSTFAL